jgi:eukaryotic-like serine/threonine-protein kinase
MIGQTIGKYQITAKIGEGGMGVVFKATDTTLDREVAIKMLLPTLTSEPELKARFHTEAKINAKLSHPAIITVFDFLFERDNFFIVMEFIKGKTGEDLVNEIGPVPYQRLLPIFKQVTSGLAYAHKQGVIHRDIKPSNIILTDPGDIKIMDFGIARIVGSQRMTSTGVAVGSILYMSPEQIKNKDVDHRSDIYALGITLFEMATGKVPFDSPNGSEYEIMQQHIGNEVPAPKDIYPHIPDNIEKAIIYATQKAPEKRFQTMEEFASCLRTETINSHSTVVSTVQPSPTPAATKLETPKFKEENKKAKEPQPKIEAGGEKKTSVVFVVGIAVALLVLLGGGAYFYTSKENIKEPPTVIASAVRDSSKISPSISVPQQQVPIAEPELILQPSIKTPSTPSIREPSKVPSSKLIPQDPVLISEPKPVRQPSLQIPPTPTIMKPSKVPSSKLTPQDPVLISKSEPVLQPSPTTPATINNLTGFKSFYHANGLSGELKEGDILTSEDNYYMTFRPGQKIFLYVAQIDTAGAIYRIFPNSDFSELRNPLNPGKEYRFPEKDYFFLDNNKGKEHVFMIASENGIKEIENFFVKLSSGDDLQRKQIAVEFKAVYEQQLNKDKDTIWFWHK